MRKISQSSAAVMVALRVSVTVPVEAKSVSDDQTSIDTLEHRI